MFDNAIFRFTIAGYDSSNMHKSIEIPVTNGYLNPSKFISIVSYTFGLKVMENSQNSTQRLKIDSKINEWRLERKIWTYLRVLSKEQGKIIKEKMNSVWDQSYDYESDIPNITEFNITSITHLVCNWCKPKLEQFQS